MIDRRIFGTVSVFSLLMLPGATAAYADQEFTYDGGKRADFMAVQERNKAQLKAMRAKGAARVALSAAGPGGDDDGTCVDGVASGEFPCSEIDMAAHIGIEDFAVLSELTGLPEEESDIAIFNDIWGYTDQETRREYALLGATQGMIVIEVTVPSSPEIIGILPSQGYDIFEDDQAEGNFWRDIKVFDGHAFIVSEQTDQGMQVMDLTALADVDTSEGPVAFEAIANYDKFSSAHNIAINVDSGFAYAVGTNTCLGGIEMIDISDPANPVDAGCFKEDGYIHDTQCVIYEGPDERYQDREICINSAGDPFVPDDDPGATAISVIDVTDKTDVQRLVYLSYGGEALPGYSHQGWLTLDQRYFIHGDELDELLGSVTTTTTRIWDMADLTNPTLITEATNDNPSIDHNLYTRGIYSIHANYSSGLRIFNAENVGDGELEEVAFFDIRPEDDEPDFEGGAWSSYCYYAFQSRDTCAV
ncbi:MAG: choice-of-anchor B family protein, partial [Geminicoccaceae bacterium]